MSWPLGRASGPEGPYGGAKAVTPDDANDLPGGICQAIYASVGGAVAVVLESGDTAIVTVGSGYANRACLLIRRVKAAGTAATGIVALYV